MAKLKFHPKSNSVTLVGGTKLYNVHSIELCEGRTCVIHNPTEHHMSKWKHNFREDRGLMERICKHGIGHPDPDDLSWRKDSWWGIHGCDGCCSITKEEK